MTASAQRWGDDKIRSRLPSPASAAQAEAAQHWKQAKAALMPDRLRLPVTLEVNPGDAAMQGVRWLLRASVGALLIMVAGIWLFPRDEADPLEVVIGALFLPSLLAGLALWLWLAHRRTPSYMKLTLGRERLCFESPGVRWEARIADYSGLALRRRMTQRAPSRIGRPMRSQGDRELRLGENIELWWIQLVHEDPARDAVLWASDAHFAGSDGLSLVEQLAQVLQLPVLTTSGIRRMDDDHKPPLAGAASKRQLLRRQLPIIGRWF